MLEAGHRSSPDSQKALGELCEAYWFPLYAYVRRRLGNTHEAQDLTQDFFSRLLEKDIVASADPDRGRFRSFLLTSMKNFLSNERDKARAEKRGGGRVPISLDFESGESRIQHEPSNTLTPEKLFEREWTLTLLDRVLALLRERYIATEKGHHFEVLKPFITGGDVPGGYAEAAQQLGMSETAAKSAAHRMRQRYRELLRSQIAQTVAGPEEVDDEIGHLFQTLES